MEWLPFLIVCPLTFLGGFVDAVAGGGGLISLPAYLIAGLPAHMAIATNKLSSAMGTTLTTIRFAQKGYIRWRRGLLCAL
ncbi:MAG TPA: TSUP family transporter, partial [Candidatus Evtepia faecigallinarum]|nr:TSUP family transporter [Candidatus Evtepia faecigallinarum]